jgi:hypothetical protein
MKRYLALLIISLSVTACGTMPTPIVVTVPPWSTPTVVVRSDLEIAVDEIGNRYSFVQYSRDAEGTFDCPTDLCLSYSDRAASVSSIFRVYIESGGLEGFTSWIAFDVDDDSVERLGWATAELTYLMGANRDEYYCLADACLAQGFGELVSCGGYWTRCDFDEDEAIVSTGRITATPTP